MPLTDIEWTTCWMAMRYAKGRSSIASIMLAGDIVKEYWSRFTDLQRSMLAKEDDNHVHPAWKKFFAALNPETVTIQGKEIRIFKANGRAYPFEEYLKNPHMEVYFDDSYCSDE